MRSRGCRVWVLTALWGTLCQLAISLFNWIDGMMEDVALQVGRMLDNEAAHEPLSLTARRSRSTAWRTSGRSIPGG